MFEYVFDGFQRRRRSRTLNRLSNGLWHEQI